MKILCLCERGNSRSVALAWLLKDGLNLDAIAAGVKAMGNDTKHMLCKWADKIILVQEELKEFVPEEYWDKMVIWEVGRDRFFRGFEQDLLNQYKEYMKKEGWEITRSDM